MASCQTGSFTGPTMRLLLLMLIVCGTSFLYFFGGSSDSMSVSSSTSLRRTLITRRIRESALVITKKQSFARAGDQNVLVSDASQDIHQQQKGDEIEINVAQQSMTTTADVPPQQEEETVPTTPALSKEEQRRNRIEHFNGYDLLKYDDLLRVVEKEQQKFIDKLKIDYGEENYNKMFTKTVNDQTVSVGRELFISPTKDTTTNSYGLSWDRIKKKMMLKVLNVQKNIILQEQEGQETRNNYDDYHYSKFTYTNGGHSASAGHGNFFNESYTVVMSDAVQDIFNSLGIQFVSRQYAMGGMRSGIEIALCVQSIFGTGGAGGGDDNIDGGLDVLNWDYGMCDGNDFFKHLLYTYHTAIMNNYNSAADNSNAAGMPVHITMNAFGFLFARRLDNLIHIEKNGMAAFYMAEDVYKKDVMKNIPDTLGLDDEQIKNMPKYIRALKCGDKEVESGEPYCDDYKYNEFTCSDRSFKASWHPGWKIHALQGNLLALFFMEVLNDAVKELASHLQNINDNQQQLQQVQSLIDELMKEEIHNYELFQASDIIEDIASGMIGVAEDDSTKEMASTLIKNGDSATAENILSHQDIVDFLQIIYKKPSFCHTVLLPSDIRYRNLTTTTADNNHYNINGNERIDYDNSNYDTGVTREYANENPNTNPSPSSDDDIPSMRFVYDENKRQDFCPDTLNIDYKDYYYINQVDGWNQLTLPNEKEQKYYFPNNDDGHNFKGIIFICPLTCDWGNCPNGELLGGIKGNVVELGGPAADATDNQPQKLDINIEINDEPVTRFVKLGDCFLTQSQGGNHYWKQNNDNQYKVKIRVNEAESYLRLTSFIII